MKLGKFYYLNMEKNPERNVTTIKFFKELSDYLDENINFERIDAFDATGKDLSSKVSDLNYKLYSIYYLLLNNYMHEKPLSNSQFGCLYSHFLAFKKFYESEEDWAFICEDDLSYDFISKEKLKHYLKLCIHNTKRFDIISISCNGHRNHLSNVYEDLKSPTLFPYEVNYYYGTACYMITRKCAESLLKKFTNFFEEEKFFMMKNLKNKSCAADFLIYSNCKTAFLLPSLFTFNTNFDSNIKKDGIHEKEINTLTKKKWERFNKLENLGFSNKVYNLRVAGNSIIFKIMAKKSKKLI